MKESLSQQTANLKHKNNRHKRWKGIVSILACMVVFCTVYALILPALTAEGTPHCGKEEHTHTEDCYEKKLICGKEEGEGAHHHTDECYREEPVLVCTTPESDGHQHTDDCYTEEKVLTCTNTDPDHVHNDIDGCYTTERKLTCGKEEGEGAHHHTEECYETKRELICGQEENDGHKHTDDCYKKELVCGKEEHKHILACYSDPNADVEDGNVWQRTVSSVTLTGNWGADLAAIAQTQNGYTESTANYAVAEDGQTIHGYTRYGAWANDPYRDNWSAQFADFCLSYAGVPTSAVPQNSDCSAWNYTIPDGYTPKTGDLLLLDTDSNGSADHAGIVTSVSGSTLTAIVGDADKAVRNNTYNIGSETIKGYVSIPENPALATPTPEPTKEAEVTPEAQPTQEPEATPEVTEEPTQKPENKADDAADDKADENKTQDEDVKEDDGKKDDTANNIEVTPTPIPTPELAENQFTATLYTDSSYSAEMENQTPITVSGQLPVNAEVKAYPVENLSMENEEILYAWDISIFDENGNQWEPEERNIISVEFLDPELKEQETDYSIYYIPEMGNNQKPEKMESQVTDAGISFTAEHFSIYAVAKKGGARSSGIDFGKYITSAEMKKKQGNNWVDATEFTDGDTVKVKFEYEVKDHSVVTKENRTLSYTLPTGVRPDKELRFNVTGTIKGKSYDDLGECVVGTDGNVQIVFNDTFFETEGAFTGGFEFNGTASLNGSDQEETFKFTANGKTYTIKPREEEKDLHIEKKASKPQDGKITYTIVASSKHGTGDSVKIADKITWNGLDQVLVGNPSVKKGDKDVQYTDYITQSGNGYSNYELKLPELNAGESYTLTYTVDYGKVIGNGEASIQNSATGYKGNNYGGQSSTYTMISRKMVEKTGSAEDNNQNVKWTIKINPDRVENISGEYTLTDLLNDSALDISNISKVTDFNIIETDFMNSWKETTVTDTAYKNGRLTVRSGCFYTITYKTPVNYVGGDNSASYTNSITIKDGDKEYTDTGRVTVSKSDFFKEKKVSNDRTVSKDGKEVKQTWTITLNPTNGATDTISVVDTMTDTNGDFNEDLHYTTISLLKEQFEELKTKSDLTYSIIGYDEDGEEVDDENAKIVRFKLILTPNASWNGSAININYKSIFVIENLKDGESVTVKNAATVNGISHEAEACYKKPKRLFKYVSDAGNNWHSGSWNVDYNIVNQKLKYKIEVRPFTTDEFSVTDTLPEGLTLKKEDVKVYLGNGPSYIYDVESGWKITEHATVEVNSQELKVTFAGGFPDKLITDENSKFVIIYETDIKDSFWDNLKNDEKTYTNSVSWNGKTEQQETTVKRNTPILSKDGEQLTTTNDKEETKVKNQVKYYVTINPAGEKLNGGKNLTLKDKLNSNNAIVDLMTEQVKLYSYNANNVSDHYKGAEFSASAFQFKYDKTKNEFEVTIPDEVPCVLEYVYEIESMNNSSETTFKNDATLSGIGGSATSKSITIREADGSAWVKKADVLQLIKVDADRYQLTLQGAKFKVSKYENAAWTELPEEYETNDKGMASIDLKNLIRGNLYKVIETKAPDGYAQSNTPYYFVTLDKGKTSSEWVKDWANSNLLKGLGLKQSDIVFIDYQDFATIYVPNKSSSLKVTKFWLDKNGSLINGTQDIKVQLYQTKKKLDAKTVTVKFAGNDYKQNYGQASYQVKPGTDFVFCINWNGSVDIKIIDDEIKNLTDSGGKITYNCGKITSDITISIRGGGNWSNIETYFAHSYTPAEYVSDSVTKYGDEVTLNSSNNYTYTWENLPDTVDGLPVYYTVKEVSNLAGYMTSYMNNNGIQSGEITITNKKIETNDYVLPETGGIGTNRFTAVGLALMAGSLMCEYVMRRKRRERRGN